MADYSSAIEAAAEVKNEELPAANTSIRVGEALESIIAAAEADAILAYRDLGVCTTSTVPATYTAKDRVQYDFDAPVGNSVLTNFGGLTISSVTTPSRYKIKWNGTAWSAVLQTVIPESRIVQETGQSMTSLMSQKAVSDELAGLELKVGEKSYSITEPIIAEAYVSKVFSQTLKTGCILSGMSGFNGTIYLSPSNPYRAETSFGIKNDDLPYTLESDIKTYRVSVTANTTMDVLFASSGLVKDIEDVKILVDNKVDKVVGKELTSNDFTNEYKTNVDNLIGADDKLIIAIMTGYEVYTLDEAIPSGSVITANTFSGSYFAYYNEESDRIQIDELPYTLPCDVTRLFSNKSGTWQITIGGIDGVRKLITELSGRVDSLDKEDIIIADKIYAVVGDTLQIFHRMCVADIDYNSLRIVVDCAVGKSFSRYFELTPTLEMAGNTYVATYNVFDRHGVVKLSKQFSIVVNSLIASPTTNKNILVVGASLYSTGIITEEVRRRLCDIDGDGTPSNPTGIGCSNITFIGRKTGSVVQTIHQEASGGYGWWTYTTDAFKDLRFYISNPDLINMDDKYTIENVGISVTYYLTIKEVNITDGNILCEVYGGYVYADNVIPATGRLVRKSGSGDQYINYTSFYVESGNPFWNNGAIDFVNYSQQYCNGEDIDIITCIFGHNGLRTIDSVDEIITENLIPFITKFHADYPNGKVVLGTLISGSVNGGYGSSNGARVDVSFPFKANIYWEWNKRLIELANTDNYSTYCVLADASSQYDVDNSLPFIEKDVNNRNSSIKEKIDTDRIHPTDGGRKMVSDCLYRIINDILK